MGRIKQEVRPCVLVALQQQNETGKAWATAVGQIFLQQAETVRLGQQGGSFVRVTELQSQIKGNGNSKDTEPVLLRIQSAGTHIGKAYTGQVTER